MDNATLNQQITHAAAPMAPAFFGPRWSGWKVVLVAVVCLLGFFIAQTLIFVVILFREHPEFLFNAADAQRALADPSFIINFLTAKNLWWISVLSEAALALTTIGLVRATFKAGTANLGLTQPAISAWVAWGVGIGVSLLIVSMIVEGLQTAMFGPHPQPQALALVKHHGLADFALDFMSVGIAAPIAEEIFFRGFVFAGLVQRMAPALAMVISAALFGLAHWEAWSFFPIFAIGIGLAWAYYRTRSLWVNIVAHSTVNTISLILAYAFPQLVK